MKIRILTDIKNKVDGVRIGTYVQGQVCEVEDKLAKKLIGSAMAEVFIEPPVKVKK